MRLAIRTVLLLVLAAALAFAATGPVSKRFRVRAPQQLAGVLEDRAGAPIARLGLELLQAGKVVADAVTDAHGAYDFGVIQPGEYRIRLAQDYGWCAPVVKCKNRVCSIRPRVDICRDVDYGIGPP